MKTASKLAGIVIVIQALLLSPVIGNSSIQVAIDIRPQSCPNPFNVNSRGVLPVAILGTAEFDVSDIDVATLQLIGVGPIRSGYEDVATPLFDTCDCTTEGPDGYRDLVLKFNAQAIIEALEGMYGGLYGGEQLELQLTGQFLDGVSFVGVDCVVVVGSSNPG
ncbi:MAG: hypothetical protein JRE18_06060 [Deltaproteobacteria bacterium]|jgi:hypothetical protein|nr:hypothetical protein [Deltaproteobacteria bacterium]